MDPRQVKAAMGGVPDVPPSPTYDLSPPPGRPQMSAEQTPRAPWWTHLITPAIGGLTALAGHGDAGLALAAGGARGSSDYFSKLADEDRQKREQLFKVSMQKSENLEKRITELKGVSQLAAQKGVRDASLDQALSAWDEAMLSTGPGGKSITDSEMDKINNALLGVNEGSIRKAAQEVAAEREGQLSAQTEASKLGMPAAAYQEQQRRTREYAGQRMPFQQEGQPPIMLSPEDWAKATSAEMKGAFTPYQQGMLGVAGARVGVQGEAEKRQALVAEQTGLLQQLKEMEPPRRYMQQRAPLEARLKAIQDELAGRSGRQRVPPPPGPGLTPPPGGQEPMVKYQGKVVPLSSLPPELQETVKRAMGGK